jgi:hypothetical protein
VAKRYDYPYQYIPGRRNVRVHVLAVEAVIRRQLRGGECVHHVNGNITDNRHANLVACQDSAYHQLLERRTRALRECGHADWLRCMYCGKLDDPANLYVHINATNGWTKTRHRGCTNRYMRDYKRRRVA